MPTPVFGEASEIPIESGGNGFGAVTKHDGYLRRPQSCLNLAVHSIFDPVAKFTVGEEKLSDELADYTGGFIKTLPLFARGRLALLALIAAYAADEIKVNDSLQEQILDSGLGTAKGLLLKGTFAAFGRQGATPGMTGVGLGISSRITDAALTRSNYLDESGNLSLKRAIGTTVSTGLNPGALAVDAITYGASDMLWARIMNRSRGAAWYRPEITHAISGATMGFASEFGNQLHQQISVDGKVDAAQIVKRSLIRGSFDGVAGALGGHQTRRYMRLNRVVANNQQTRKDARSTEFQRGLVADANQIALRDGTFILDKKLPALTTETWVGWTNTPDGRWIRSIFRPDNGSEAFAHRMQSEIAAYGLQTLGFKMAVPTTVARQVELNGKTHVGYIQEMEGTSFANFAKQELGQSSSQISKKQLLGLLHENKSLQASYSNAWLHRLIMGEWDNHSLNMTVNKRQSGTPQVRNIDLGDSLRPAETLLDLTPTPGVRQGYDKINAHLYDSIAGKRLDGETLNYLKDIQTRFSRPEERSKLHSVGLTSQQADGLLGRTNWLLRNEKMPVHREALFYLHLNDARRALESWFGKPKARSADDQTNYFLDTF